ncbi:DUF2490 domain-containing protein [Flavobacteriaceae bacterium TP-CH-4]|uniref:DUF2490 domain-containing protein n=1 Tax=Pelagihabitans pacificus TaxID=2696054 RepID=A0A967AV16_9FLAO|nr:DUF2490 domain-containing protein [Pelagihabitans pacificus]NHF59900.1 DUF2490 domain-containing protein [Pelagihabitans pacificus]
MKFPFQLVGFVLVLLWTSITMAQNRDFLTWSSVELGYEPSKTWNFDLEGQLRLKDDSATIDEYFGQFQVNRRIVKGLNIRFGIRYIFENDNQGRVQGYENHLRYHTDLRYRHKIDRFTLKYRFRYQNKNELGVDDDPRQFLRLKAGFVYNIRGWKLDPDLSGELFNRLVTDDGIIDKYRITLRTRYKIKNAGHIGAFLRFQSSTEDEDRESAFIIGLQYGYTLK